MKRTYATLLMTVVALLFASAPLSAQTLGTAGSYGVLAGSTVSNTGASTIRGDVGVSPGTAIIGFPPGTVTNGTIHSADASALQAQNDVTTAYNVLAGLPCNTVLTGQDLGGMTLTPGNYCFASSAQLTGTLTLDAQGNPNAQFVFQIGTTLTTASNSIVRVINSGNNCNVFWQVGSSATLGTATVFAGNILALTSITATTGASVSGRLLARNGAVTLDTNNVAVCPLCTPITISPSTLPNGTIGAAYSQTLTAAGGTAPYTFALLSGSLPPGLTLSGVGLVSGTPTTLGSYTFTVQATDAVGCFGSRLYTIVVNAVGCPILTLAPTSLPPAVAGTPYGPVSITASGGTAPYTYAVTLGALPLGLTLSTGGVISGTPTQSGSYTVTVTATDALGCQGSQIYSALVGCPPILVSPVTLPAVIVGSPYSVTMVGSGGTAPYTFSVTGALPPGLTLAAGGLLSGTPTANGIFVFTITATDAAGCTGARPFNLGGTTVAVNGATLDTVGLSVLVLLLAIGGVFLVNRFRM